MHSRRSFFGRFAALLAAIPLVRKIAVAKEPHKPVEPTYHPLYPDLPRGFHRDWRPDTRNPYEQWCDPK